jgi:hypothetical protein
MSCSRDEQTAYGTAPLTVPVNTEQTTGCVQVENCLVFGRCVIQRWVSPAIAAGMASGRFTPRFKQWLWWEIKKIAKTVGDAYYLKLRESWANGFNPGIQRLDK